MFSLKISQLSWAPSSLVATSKATAPSNSLKVKKKVKSALKYKVLILLLACPVLLQNLGPIVSEWGGSPVVSAASSHTINEISFLSPLLMVFRCRAALLFGISVLRRGAFLNSHSWVLCNTLCQQFTKESNQRYSTNNYYKMLTVLQWLGKKTNHRYEGFE